MSDADIPEPQARAIWPPVPGLFRLPLVKRGWGVPCRILWTADGWQADIDGTLYPSHADPAQAAHVARIWHYGAFVTASEYGWLLAVKDHARARDPDHPAVRPLQAMDPRTLKPIQPRRTPTQC